MSGFTDILYIMCVYIYIYIYRELILTKAKCIFPKQCLHYGVLTYIRKLVLVTCPGVGRAFALIHAQASQMDYMACTTLQRYGRVGNFAQ